VGGIGDLEAADSYCRLLANRHYENFTVAARILPAELRRDLSRIYGFCRTTDDLGDESGTVDQGRTRLERWRAEVEAMFAGRLPVHPVLFALRLTVAKHRLESQPFLDLIAANVQDQEVSSYETWAAIEGYCRFSAAPVGRMVLGVFGMDSPAARPLSDDVCIGLQLANFVQDVARDAAIGRRYLVEADVRELGMAGAIERMCGRARELLDSGRALEQMAPPLLRLQLSLYRMGGQAICDAVQATGYATDVVRPVVSKRTKLNLAGRALAGTLLSRGRGGRRLPA
jgi:squalene synthase HpnC